MKSLAQSFSHKQFKIINKIYYIKIQIRFLGFMRFVAGWSVPFHSIFILQRFSATTPVALKYSIFNVSYLLHAGRLSSLSASLFMHDRSACRSKGALKKLVSIKYSVHIFYFLCGATFPFLHSQKLNDLHFVPLQMHRQFKEDDEKLKNLFTHTPKTSRLSSAFCSSIMQLLLLKNILKEIATELRINKS